MVNEDGYPLNGMALESARKDFAIRQNPTSLWDRKWLDAFSFFVNVEGIFVDTREVTTLVERGALHSTHY